MSVRDVLFDRVRKVLVHQDQKWGPEHDDCHQTNDWIVLIVKHATKETWSDDKDPEYFVYSMLVVAALAISAAESRLRNSATVEAREKARSDG